MKKVLLLLAIVALVSTTGTVRSAGVSSMQVAAGPQAPKQVMTTFNDLISDLMAVYFSWSTEFDASEVIWTKVKKEWRCSGFVRQVSSTGNGIRVDLGRFDQDGDLIEFLYSIVYVPE